MIATLIILCSLIVISNVSGNIISRSVKLAEQSDMTCVQGQIVPVQNSKSLIDCLVKCAKPCSCLGVLFNENLNAESKCKQVLTGGTSLNGSVFNGYDIYLKRKIDIGIGVKVSSCWSSGSPVLYFPLEDIGNGIAAGEIPANVQFIPGGILGNVFYNPTVTHNNAGYLKLGMYPANGYCFPEPAICPDGVTLAFWLNILGSTGINQGFLTTMTPNGPGLSVLWLENDGFVFAIQRDQDTFSEYVTIPKSTFLADYVYNTWQHYVVTYKYDGSNNGNNLEAYVNGEQRPDSEKSTFNGFLFNAPNTEDYNGGLHLGVFFLDNPTRRGNMKMDEFVIWEKKMPTEDVKRLYEAYPCI